MIMQHKSLVIPSLSSKTKLKHPILRGYFLKIIPWLGRRFWNRTFEETEQGSDILEIRKLLDEENDDVSQSSTK